jgi:alpha-tubulin suppressor-like RCC1 family protein
MKTKLLSLLIILLSYAQINAQCWQSIYAGESYTLALDSDGTLWAWGTGSSKLLSGDYSTENDYNIPTIGFSSSAKSFRYISPGGSNGFGLKTDNTLHFWGKNDYGQRGDGTTLPSSFPIQTTTATNWKSVAVGGSSYTIAIKTNGSLWTCGNNNYGQLGDGTTNNKNVFIQIGTDTNWESITAGDQCTFGIKTDRTLWSWGSNTDGSLGIGGSSSYKTSPTQVGTATNWKSISIEYEHCVAIKTDGTLWAWGWNYWGQLGDETTSNRNTPMQIGTATNWSSAVAGFSHTIAIKTDGTLWAWGLNNKGQLGDGTNINKNIPTQIKTESNWKSVTAGIYHTLATKTDGTLWAWGDNQYGQLGDGTNINKSTPTKISCTALGLEKIITDSNYISIYPNPVKEILYLQNETIKAIEKIVIIDISGKKVLEQVGNNKQMNIQQLHQGMYFLQILSEGKSSQFKFIKQ